MVCSPFTYALILRILSLMSSSAHYSTVMSLKYRVKRFHFEVLCSAVRHVAQLGNCWCFVVTLAGLCWQDIGLVSALVGDIQRSPPYRHGADLSGWAPCRQGGWPHGFRVSCQLKASDLQVVPFWSKMQKVLPPCCMKST